jgi:two-component system, cell cycle sensor histidine kinase and response regulator CckA
MPYILGLLFIMSLFLAPCSWASSPNIVIINSYHYGQEWSDRELAGLMEVLRNKYHGRLASVEYLDAKRLDSRTHRRRMASFLAEKYAGTKIDLVIALDNPALELLLANRTKLFPDAPIVFAGINNYTPSMIEGQKKITGLAEATDIRRSIELILKVTPATKRIIILHDYTVTGLQSLREIEPGLSPFMNRVAISFLPALTFEEIQKKINSLPQDSAVLNLSFVKDSAGKTLPVADSARMFTSGNRIPFYSTHETLLGHGVIGGNMRSGMEHGRKAGQIALRVLAGEDPLSIPVDKTDHSVPMFDYSVMTRLGISPDSLPAGSIMINKPVTFYEQHKTPIMYALGIIALMSGALVVLSVNIVKRRRAEKKLSELTRYTSALFEEARDAIFVADPETGIILDVNHAAEDLMKKPKSDLIGLHQSALHPTEESVQIFRQQSRGLSNIAETQIITSEGRQTPVEINANVLELPDGRRVIMGVFRDVSERNRLQEQLLHAQKMEAIGKLSGGVAHEFNNVLTAIIGAAELLKMEIAQDSRFNNLIDIIIRSSNNAARLTQGLLSFCRKQVSAARQVNINTLLLQQENLVAKLLGNDIRITRELSESPCIVRADPGQIEQIVMNIILNAKDAMPDGGSLGILTKPVSIRETPDSIFGAIRPGDYVLISVKDTGSGIDASVKDKIFEPFFTTKGVGKGTGLGLSIVYGIVTQNNGFVDVKTEAGHGTEFRVFLPRCPDPVQQEQVENVRENRDHKETGAVLLAEDNEIVRHMQSIILKNAGYEVIEAVDGKEAVELFRENADRISIAVIDVVMPVMNGKEVLDAIMQLKPGIKTLVVSGHTDDIITSKGIEQDKIDFLAKPFTPLQLLKRIRELAQKEPEKE